MIIVFLCDLNYDMSKTLDWRWSVNWPKSAFTNFPTDFNYDLVFHAMPQAISAEGIGDNAWLFLREWYGIFTWTIQKFSSGKNKGNVQNTLYEVKVPRRDQADHCRLFSKLEVQLSHDAKEGNHKLWPWVPRMGVTLIPDFAIDASQRHHLYLTGVGFGLQHEVGKNANSGQHV